jgi:hypothetical protein
MNELLKQRILRRLESLSDERAYQVLDYVEFLESRYGRRSESGGLLAKLTETAEDTLRAAGVPLRAISGTMGLVESASKVMQGVVAAAAAVVDEAVKAVPPRQASPTVEGTAGERGAAP